MYAVCMYVCMHESQNIYNFFFCLTSMSVLEHTDFHNNTFIQNPMHFSLSHLTILFICVGGHNHWGVGFCFV